MCIKETITSVFLFLLLLTVPGFTADIVPEDIDSNYIPDSGIVQDEVLTMDTLVSNDSLLNSLSDSLTKLQQSPDSIATDSISNSLQDSIGTRDSSRFTFRKLFVKTQSRFLYPGISDEQDHIAQSMVNSIYSYDWDEAERNAKKLQKLERRNKLPPLSYLLMVAQRVIRVQNNEYNRAKVERTLLKEIDSLTERAMKVNDYSDCRDSTIVTRMLIAGGIKGFSATLKMKTNIVEAAIEGFQALKLLERVIAINPKIKDAELGLGIFYCALSKAPPIVRGTLNISGKNISLDTGLDHLRASAEDGHYTHAIAKQYLIQFLSPYYGHMVVEKQRIFRSLQRAYPHNPYYVFLETDEYLCFRPEGFLKYSNRDLFKKKIRLLRQDTYSSRKYLNLIKWQCYMLNPESNFQPDTTFDLNEFSYYPIFLEAVQEKYYQENIVSRPTPLKPRNGHHKLGEKAYRLLDASSMNPTRKGYFSWHIRDALRND